MLLGPSGSGKSSLINALLGEGRLAVGDVRAGDQRGRHTTTWRELIVLPTGGVLIDTPGIRSVGLVEGDALAETFGEIDALLGSCRFSDCSHTTEPGCALNAAVADGRVSPERLTSWRKLQTASWRASIPRIDARPRPRPPASEGHATTSQPRSALRSQATRR